MSSFNQLCRFGNNVIVGYKTLLQRRIYWPNPIQVFNFTRKSAEQILGIEKPKRPLTPFFKFMTQLRPALIAKNPGITSKEAISWTSKHWQELDDKTKSQMQKEYEKDVEDYKKIKAMYESSLTDQQKADIKKVREELIAAREKRKLRAVFKELGRPKKPMSSYLLFMQSRKESLVGKSIKEYQQKAKEEWSKLSENEKAKFEKEAQDLMNKYRKDLEAWELKMISIGRSELVRSQPVREKKTKTIKKPQ